MLNKFSKYTLCSRNLSSSVLSRPKRVYETVDVIIKTCNKPTYTKILGRRNELEQSPKVFYEITLDGRPLKTPSGQILRLTSEPMALAIALEWETQNTEICQDLMRLTGLAFTSSDNPLGEKEHSLASKILDFIDTDTLLYFADSENSLFDEQQRKWTPIIRWANLHYGLELRPTQSIMESPEIPQSSRIRLTALLQSYNFESLVGLDYAVRAVKSLLIAFACISDHIDVDEATKLSQLEQIHQTTVWGNVEWAHDVDNQDIRARLAAGVLFFECL